MRARLTASFVVLAAACSPGPRAPHVDARAPARTARALLFRASGFPTIDAPPIADDVLDAALAGLPVERATTAAELDARLGSFDVLVLPYGSAFPVDAWPRIQSFLSRGGGLAVLGGAPLHEPVHAEHGQWVTGPRTTTFAHALLVGPAEPIARGDGWTTRPLVPSLAFPEAKTTWALTLRLTTEKDFPDEHGTSGPRERVARPLVHLLDERGIPRGCPLVEIDHLRGAAAGARWVFATSDAKLDPPAVRAVVTRALEGASELRAIPERASVAPGEVPRVRLLATRVKAERAHVTVTDASGRAVQELDAPLAGSVAITAPLTPGLHHVTVTAGGAVAATGFWVKDAALLASGPKLQVSRDWLRKDGKVFPVVGTTYMASDVHRDFLFEPNPHAWDADFAEMKRRGVNLVRTGLWTAWSRAVSREGAVDPAVLAALDAFVQTAARHGILVCFDLFAFLPLAFGGDNPYLDPRALEGQRRMVTDFASRYRGVSWIHWDLINEPSYAQRKDLWSTRPIGDPHEKEAWRAYVRARHGDDEGAIRALWRDPSPDLYAVPRPEDFEVKFVQNARRPRKARDFQEFKEEVVAAWAARLRAAIRDAGGDTLVTLGQDEGGIHERPTQQVLSGVLDYTAVHTWWKNDDLLWDGVLTKVPEKPTLHQETGLMRLEDLDGVPWRTPDAAARLLERKIGYAFAGRGAGVVEWVWNVNPYMPIDEESTIGIFRPDGTAKPELEPLVTASAFFAEAASRLDDFAPDPVVLVVPHARAFLGMPNGLDATKVVVRTLAERFGVVPTAISDLRLTAARLAGAKLILVPSPDVLDEPAARALLEASRAGAKVLVTGAALGDSYGRSTPSLAALGLLGASRPVAMHEATPWSASGWVLFEGQQELSRRAAAPSLASLADGSNVWHEPLPLELAREREPLVRLLDAALRAAHVATMPGEWGLAARVLLTPAVALAVVVNERPEPAVRVVVVDGRAIRVPVRALATRLVLVERASGKILVATPGEPPG